MLKIGSPQINCSPVKICQCQWKPLCICQPSNISWFFSTWLRRRCPFDLQLPRYPKISCCCCRKVQNFTIFETDHFEINRSIRDIWSRLCSSWSLAWKYWQGLSDRSLSMETCMHLPRHRIHHDSVQLDRCLHPSSWWSSTSVIPEDKLMKLLLSSIRVPKNVFKLPLWAY